MTELAQVLARTRALQAKAASPEACAWVSANDVPNCSTE